MKRFMKLAFAAVVMISVITCMGTPLGPIPEKPITGMPPPAPDIAHDWKAALQATLEAQAKGNWQRVAVATEWEWPAFQDYRLYYRARAEEFAMRFTEASGMYAQMVSEAPLSIFADDARERRFTAAASAGAADVTAVTQTEAWAARTAGASESARRRFILGRIYEAAGRTSDAVQAYRRIRIEWPASGSAAQAEARLNALESQGFESLSRIESRKRADALFAARAYDGAFEAYSALLADASAPAERQELYLRRGLSRFHRRGYVEASVLFERAYTVAPKSENAEQSRYYHAFALSRQGQGNEAVRLYERLSKTAKSRWASEALFKAGLIHLQEGRNELAAERFEAYLKAAERGELRPDALWWLAWARFNTKNYSAAREAFFSRSRVGDEAATAARYWMARCDELLGDKESATASFAAIASAAPLQYYGLLAWSRASQSARPQPARGLYYADMTTLSAEDNARYHLDRGAVLGEIRRTAEAEREYQAAAQTGGSRDSVVLASRALAGLNRYNAAQRMVWAAFEPELLRQDVFFTDLWELAYPRAFASLVTAASALRGTNPNMVLALMREESRYNPEVASPADAYGLLQLILPTAKRVAKSLGIPAPKAGDLYKPDLNIALGTAYIHTLLDAYSNNFFLAFAGYNGGPQNVNRWLSLRSGNDMDQFVENIPFTETRNYVKKVTTSLLRYQFLYEPNQAISPSFLTAAASESEQAAGLE